MFKQLKAWARAIKSKLTALYYAQQHPGTPWYCHVLLVIILAYALSPIDLIPDFIPLLGLLDDLLLLPLGIYLASKLLPPAIWQHSLLRAEKEPLRLKKKLAGLLLIAVGWLVIGFLLWHYWLKAYLA